MEATGWALGGETPMDINDWGMKGRLHGTLPATSGTTAVWSRRAMADD